MRSLLRGGRETEQFVTRAIRVVVTDLREELSGGFTAGFDPEPLAGALDVLVDRERRQVELAANLLGVHVLRDEAQALAFTRGQSREFSIQSLSCITVHTHRLLANLISRRLSCV